MRKTNLSGRRIGLSGLSMIAGLAGAAWAQFKTSSLLTQLLLRSHLNRRWPTQTQDSTEY